MLIFQYRDIYINNPTRIPTKVNKNTYNQHYTNVSYSFLYVFYVNNFIYFFIFETKIINKKISDSSKGNNFIYT